jgi:hypothetical protein
VEARKMTACAQEFEWGSKNALWQKKRPGTRQKIVSEEKREAEEILSSSSGGEEDGK